MQPRFLFTFPKGDGNENNNESKPPSSIVKDKNYRFKYWEHHLEEREQESDYENFKSEEASTSNLTHVDSGGKARMVDVGEKVPTDRRAVAEATVWLGTKVFDLVKENRLKKGDVLSVARLAGIMGAKATPNLIPLCHPLNLTHVDVEVSLNADDNSIKIVSHARTISATGVEMEALTSASVAALTVYDMCKAVSHDIVIGDVRLLSKTGGKRDFRRG